MQNQHPKTKSNSVFSYGAKNLDYNKGYTLHYITLSKYCKLKFISRSIARKFIKWGWLACTKSRTTRICVAELCPDEIKNYIMQ